MASFATPGYAYDSNASTSEQSIISASVTNVPERQTILTQASFHAVQNYVAC